MKEQVPDQQPEQQDEGNPTKGTSWRWPAGVAVVCLIVAAVLSIHEEVKRDRAAEASTRSVAAPSATTTVETRNGRPLMSPYTPPTTTTTTFVETAAIYTPSPRPAAPPTSAYTRPPAPVTTIPPLAAKR